MPNTDSQVHGGKEAHTCLIQTVRQVPRFVCLKHLYIDTYKCITLLLQTYIILKIDISTIFGFAVFSDFHDIHTCVNTEIWTYGN